MALCVFAWIPAYAGTTMLLSLAKLEARGCSRFFAPIVVPAIFPRTVVGLRREDQGIECRQVQGNAILIWLEAEAR